MHPGQGFLHTHRVRVPGTICPGETKPVDLGFQAKSGRLDRRRLVSVFRSFAIATALPAVVPASRRHFIQMPVWETRGPGVPCGGV